MDIESYIQEAVFLGLSEITMDLEDTILYSRFFPANASLSTEDTGTFVWEMVMSFVASITTFR